MSTITSIANQMAKKFISARDKRYVLNLIVYDLNFLVYTNTKEPLGYAAKSTILRHIFNIVAGREKLHLSTGEELTPDFTDIVIFFERRSFILKQLRAGIKHQEEFN